MELLKYNIFLLRITGLWPDAPTSVFRFIRRDLLTMFIIYPIIYFGSMSVIVRQMLGYKTDLKVLFTAIMSIMKGIDIVLTLIIFYQKRQQIIDLCRQLQDLDKHFECPDALKYERKIRKFTVIIIIYAVIFGLPYVISPMFQSSSCKKERDIILQNTTWPCGFYTPLWYPFPINEYPYYYIMIFCVIVHAFSFLFSGFGIRTYMFALVEHTIRHLRNLKRNLKIAVDSQGKKISFVKCVKYHIAIVKFFNRVDHCYSFINAAYMALIASIIGMAEYHLATELTAAGFSKILPEIFAWTFMLFLLSYIPQRLWNESLTMGNHLYACNWKDCSISMQKDIKLMLQKLHEPLSLSAGPFGKLGLSNFVNILYSAYSFFAILINIKHN